jgi:hypothetical protein
MTDTQPHLVVRVGIVLPAPAQGESLRPEPARRLRPARSEERASHFLTPGIGAIVRCLSLTPSPEEGSLGIALHHWIDLAEIRVNAMESRFAACLNRLLQQNRHF